MTELLLNPADEAQLADVIARPPHALIIAGTAGMGKGAFTTRLCSQLLSITEEKVSHNATILCISIAESGSIGIEQAREVQHFLKLRTVGAKSGITRIVCISDAQALTTEAQNALLKTIEEPPEGSLLILATTNERLLLPTIVSRSQLLQLHKPDIKALEALLLKAGYDHQQVTLALRVSGGLPGLTYQLLADGDEHPLHQALQQARTLLSQSAYERLAIVDGLAKQRQQCLDICYVLEQMAHVALQSATQATAQRWQNVLKAAYDCREALMARANAKLAMTTLMLSL